MAWSVAHNIEIDKATSLMSKLEWFGKNRRNHNKADNGLLTLHYTHPFKKNKKKCTHTQTHYIIKIVKEEQKKKAIAHKSQFINFKLSYL